MKSHVVCDGVCHPVARSVGRTEGGKDGYMGLDAQLRKLLIEKRERTQRGRAAGEERGIWNESGCCRAELSPINRYGSTVAKFLTVHCSEKVV